MIVGSCSKFSLFFISGLWDNSDWLVFLQCRWEICSNCDLIFDTKTCMCFAALAG